MSSLALRRSVTSEFLGSATLAGVVVASGIAGESMSPGSPAVALLCNALATAGALFVLITVLGPVSGAHFNPLVTLAERGFSRGQRIRTAATGITQVVGCATGVIIANVTFSKSPVTFSTHHRVTMAHLISEVVATAGLLFVITGLVRLRREPILPVAVATYIGVAYFACSSTSFANPAITVGRMLTESFAGIAPSSVVPFIVAQIIGAILGHQLARHLIEEKRSPK